MLINKPLISIITGITALGFSAIALAEEGDRDEHVEHVDHGFILGIQGGYADTHWDNLLNVINNTTFASAASVSDTGFAARGYVGYYFNKYIGLESGYTFLPNAKASGTSTITGGAFEEKIKNYAIDLLVRLTVPVTETFGLYAKAGGSYFHSKYTPPITNDIVTTDINN